jgi:hypothetical protein
MITRAAVLTLLVAACLAQAFAASDIVYVSFNGADTHPCTRVSPCKTITHALTIVSTGGEVDIIGSGTYDNFKVSKAVTVAAEPGVLASFDVPSSAVGITIAAGGSDTVTVRGLNVHGHGSGNGIQVNSAGRVIVEDCVSRNFSGALVFSPSAAADLTVKGGVFESPSDTGIFVCCAIGGTAANVAIDGVKVEDGHIHGINADATNITVTHSSLSGPGSGALGIIVAHGKAVVEDDVISNYGVGVWVSDTAYLSSNTITGNVTGVFLESGTAFSRGNNTIEANGTNVSGTLTPFSGQ